MNPEAHTIIESLKRHVPGNPVHPNDVHTFQSFHIARLHVLIAEEQEKSAAKLERQTDKLISLTRWIVGLTVALFLLTVYLCYHEYRAGQHPQLGEQRTTQQ